jgi:hypothetical protein
MMKTEVMIMPNRYCYSLNDMIRYAIPGNGNRNLRQDTEIMIPTTFFNGDIRDAFEGSYAALGEYQEDLDGNDTIDIQELSAYFPGIFDAGLKTNVSALLKNILDRTGTLQIVTSDIELDWSLELHDRYTVGKTTSYTYTSEEALIAFAAIFGDYLRRLERFVWNTYSRYTVIIEMYEVRLDDANNALSKITSGATNEVKFNDTPQVSDGTVDSHLTNYTKTTSTSTTDANTIMARIAEIEEKMSDVYKNWTDEYIRAFHVV